jgi:hypothetical protein
MSCATLIHGKNSEDQSLTNPEFVFGGLWVFRRKIPRHPRARRAGFVDCSRKLSSATVLFLSLIQKQLGLGAA